MAVELMVATVELVFGFSVIRFSFLECKVLIYNLMMLMMISLTIMMIMF